jgi:hypothetical protein
MNDHRALEELASRLWDERRIVTYLLYKLTVTKLLLAADDRRFVPDALEEVDRTVDLLRQGEARRDQAVRELAGIWQMAPDQLTLEALVHHAPAPHDHIFREHLSAFQELAGEIEAVARENRTLATSEIDHLSTTIQQLTGVERPQPTTYDASGRLDNTTAVGGHLRKVL